MSDKKKLSELEKIKQRIAQDKKKLREIEARERNRKNAIVAGAIAKAVKGGRLMKKQYADILDHYVTDDKDRQLLKLSPYDKPEAEQQEAETVTQSDGDTPATLEAVQQQLEQQHNGHQHQPEYSHNSL